MGAAAGKEPPVAITQDYSCNEEEHAASGGPNKLDGLKESISTNMQDMFLSTAAGQVMLRQKVYSLVTFGDAEKEPSYEAVQAFEFNAWKEGDDYNPVFREHRPYSCKGWQDNSPAIGSTAPDGTVYSITEDGKAGSQGSLMGYVNTLGELHGSDKVGVLFCSATCPIFRMLAHQDFPAVFKAAKVPLLFVYIVEAHAQDGFHHDMNNGKWDLPGPKTLDERASYALQYAKKELLCKRFDLDPKEIPMVMDTMDNSLELAYEARPFRAYVLKTGTGEVLHKSGLAPFNPMAKYDLLASALDLPPDFAYAKMVKSGMTSKPAPE